MKTKTLIIAFLFSFLAFTQKGIGQVSDDSATSYVTTYIYNNDTFYVTPLMVHTALDLIITSKINKDSIVSGDDFINYLNNDKSNSDSIKLDTAALRSYFANIDSLFWSDDGSQVFPKSSRWIYAPARFEADGLVQFDSVGVLGISGQILDGSDSLVDADAVYDFGQTLLDSIYFDFGSTWESADAWFGLNDTILIDTTSLSWSDTVVGASGEKIFTQYDYDTTGQWSTWSPSLSWTGGTPTIDATVYRYQWENSYTIKFHIKIQATNETGSGISALNITLPVTPSDINSGQEIHASVGTSLSGATKGDWYIDMNDNTANNRKIYSRRLSFPNSTTYYFFISGWYEVSR